MKYISLDIETTALRPKEPKNIIGISMIYEDSRVDTDLYKLPHFTRLIARDTWTGSTYALGMNGWLLDMISGRTESKFKISDATVWAKEASDWLHAISAKFNKGNRLVLAGKNVGSFDLQFLPSIISKHFMARLIDPGSRMFDWDDEKPPSLGDCKKMAGLPPDVAHDMYEDALDVIRVNRWDRDNRKTLGLDRKSRFDEVIKKL